MHPTWKRLVELAIAGGYAEKRGDRIYIEFPLKKTIRTGKK